MADAIKPITFLDYDKISDTLMWFENSNYQLRFSVKLNRKDKNGYNRPFHSEISFYNKIIDKDSIIIKRDYKYFFSIEKSNSNIDDNIILKPNDIEILKMIINNTFYPWFFGNKNVYAIDPNGKLCVKKDVKVFKFVISNTSYIGFKPIVYYYKNSDDVKQGVFVEINSPDNSFEISIDNFLQFTSIVLNTDMVNAAMNMLNYVKVKPYGMNNIELKDNSGSNNNRNGFFNR